MRRIVIDPRVVKHLGRDLITSPEVAIIELVKNSIDARATNINLKLFNNGIPDVLQNSPVASVIPQQYFHMPLLIVEDDGYGMTDEVIDSGFLRIATNIKSNQEDTLGEKGIGRLATQRLGATLLVETCSAKEDHTSFVFINWDDIINGAEEVPSFDGLATKPHTRLWIFGVNLEDYIDNAMQFSQMSFIDTGAVVQINRDLKSALNFLISPFENTPNVPRTPQINFYFNDQQIDITFPYDMLALAESIHEFKFSPNEEQLLNYGLSIKPWFIERVHRALVKAEAFKRLKKPHDQLKIRIEEQYNLINDELMLTAYEAGAKYGIGVDHPSYFDELYDDYILFENRAKSIRIYTDFSAETQMLFVSDIDRATEDKSVVCIVDNYLAGTNRAQEIINLISAKNTPKRKNIIGGVFSSKELFEEISDKLYFEYASKETPDRLKVCLAKSAYNYFISVLQEKTIDGLNKAFETAIKNKGIAFFLSRKAQKEGMSEYEIINDWVKLLSITAPEDSDTIKRLIGLSRVINILDEDDLPDDSLQRLNTLEAFDYSINDYYLPVAAGDVFTNDQGEWFVLIGQDCDMARRPNTPPRNALAELLPANIRRQTSCKKWANDLETASIYSFRKSQEAESKILQVNYQQRKFIANEIINLCAFNTDGQCRIPLIDPPSKEQVQLMPGYMITYYTELQKYFSSVKVLKEQVNDAFETVISNEYAPRLLSVGDYTIDADVAFFNLRRVCRLTHSYVYYLYKLFLEYRGRQPFQTINLIRQEEVTLPVVFNRTESGVFMSIRCVPVPDKPNRRDYCWIISLDELNRVLGKLEDNVTVCEGVKEDQIR